MSLLARRARSRAAAALVLLVALAASRSAPAQSAPVPVQISVSLGDNFDPLVGVADQRIAIYGTFGDSTIVVTDARGSATARLSPGRYRFVTSPPYRWHARDWRWDLPVTVRTGMGVVDMQQRNAISTVATSGDPNGPFPIGGGASGTTPAAIVRAKEPATGVILSLLVGGGGQLYAGQTGKGVALLAAYLASAGGAYALYDHQCRRHDPCNATGTALAGAVALADLVYGAATAPADVQRWNRAHGVQVAPTFDVRSRAPGLGLRLRW